MFYHYTHALVRGLPATFEDSLKLEPPPVPIDIAKAHEQHEDYTRLVLELVPLVIDVPADDACPDCVFIEDSIIIIDEVAVLCRSGAPSRLVKPFTAVLRFENSIV